MKLPVMLSICGRQTYADQEPDTIELVTEGTMEFRDNGWDICYEESELTGLKGVTTTFRVEPQKVTLTRTGKLHSQMVFQEGVPHDSLYQMEFGAFMITVCATRIFAQLVFPVPREPQNKYAWDILSFDTSYLRISVILSCPHTSSNVCGLHFRYKA